jgi:hypothetical protein
MRKALIEDEGLISSLLEDLAITLSNQDQFIAHSRSSGICDRAIQLPARASDLKAATDDLGEA